MPLAVHILIKINQVFYQLEVCRPCLQHFKTLHYSSVFAANKCFYSSHTIFFLAILFSSSSKWFLISFS